MGTDFSEVVETPTYSCSSFKVHHGMCTDLMRLVDKIAKKFPEIEAAQPRCSAGIQALCLLNCALEKATLLLQYCSESSKLYLAVTGEAIVRRCQRSRDLLEESLSQLQHMVPVMLAAEISQIIDDLQSAPFVFDASEEEAGKIMRNLLQQNASAADSLECSEVKALQLAASKLHITSPKAILIEKRSIKKLLDNVGDGDHSRRKILRYFLFLLKKYGKLIIEEQKDVTSYQEEGSFSITSQSAEIKSRTVKGICESQNDISCRAIPPEEFICPISLRIMYDPVVIDSGLTFERAWIQKWFDEGNDTCPKTKVKLGHRSLTPNVNMKDLISKWCIKHGIAVPDPRLESLHSSDISSTSIASFSSSMNDLRLPLDASNLSLRSLDTSFSADDVQIYQVSMNKDKIDLSKLAEFEWESQFMMVENARSHLKHDYQVCDSLSYNNFVRPLLTFLREAQDLGDIEAQRGGLRLLLSLVSKTRDRIPCLEDDAFSMLASFLDSNVMEEPLSIIKLLSNYPYYISKIVASGALPFILDLLDSRNQKFQEQAIAILCNLSINDGIHTRNLPSECIPKLVPFLNNPTLAGHCLQTLKHMCDSEEARVYVAETSGCLPSIAELLEIGSQEDQEYAVDILLSLCSQRVRYCDLVMNEGIIPALVNISINGNDKGKVSSQELLRLLRDVEYSPDEQQCHVSGIETSVDSSIIQNEKKLSHKTQGIFGRKFSVFSKSQFTCTRKEERRRKV